MTLLDFFITNFDQPDFFIDPALTWHRLYLQRNKLNAQQFAACCMAIAGNMNYKVFSDGCIGDTIVK